MTGVAPRARRLFFALWPEPALREALWQETREQLQRCGGRLVPQDNLHLTLVFLGEVGQAQQAAVVAAARRLPLARFELLLDRYGWFESAQVLWLGCSQTPASLLALASALAGKAQAAGLRIDPRAFHPHVTLARKLRNPPDLAPPRPVAWRVDGFVLAESLSGPGGPRYAVLERFADSG
ncbi:MAG: RNA 2',3'-cyclic phosphodiesterase [Gammaproteobacteria bacterium]|nr:MAG: RNA 2',3'-cyclic phosphodiesterase [Gammaproteobacteria bacterium]